MSAEHHRTIDPMGRIRRHGRRHHRPDEGMGGPFGGPFAGRPGRPFGPRGGMGFPEGVPFMGRGRGARRGEVRVAILALLAERPMHGYQVITELAERSEGAWRPSAGSIYPTLQQLADEGLVRDTEVDGRRVYELTDEGRAFVERTKPQTPPWERPAHDGAHELRRAAQGVLSATMQIGRDGDAAMRAEAQRILADARRSLYRLLAEDGTPDAETMDGAGQDAG
ncbi:MAG: PadR family transcriptional regulator, partial [Chloroflexota bacterium]